MSRLFASLRPHRLLESLFGNSLSHFRCQLLCLLNVWGCYFCDTPLVMKVIC